MEAAPTRMDRKSSIETEPRTLRIDQIKFARVKGMQRVRYTRGSIYMEAAKYVVNTKNIEEAMSIFTEGLEPVASSIKQNGDETMIDSVEEPEYSDDYFIRPRGPQDVVSAPF
ncbi:uncharacterized protein LOC103947494 isoform X1 [Pyrus x bretschneideri]|uniref:uncharacterized protein LOC103947494 isoform X1 n=1 Tax=Pyrus x bretschneideri TaxID=225117 RepID=UPI00202E929B|nr:uncharacterized protein LOC103947494 isoform X1 [Pyrus x bretschneideri]